MPSSILLPPGTREMVPTATPSAIKTPQETPSTDKSMQHLITSHSIPNLATLLQLRPSARTSRFHSRPTATPDFLERGRMALNSGNLVFGRYVLLNYLVVAMLNRIWIMNAEGWCKRINTTKNREVALSSYLLLIWYSEPCAWDC